MLLQTIWALGFSMIALSALIYLPKRLLLVIALAIICGHNALDRLTYLATIFGLSYGLFCIISNYLFLALFGY
jgi:uncharacterized membrane protein